MRQTKGGSPIKVGIAIGILIFLFLGAVIGLQFMSNSVDSTVDDNTNYFEEESDAENSGLEREENRDMSKVLLELHDGSSNVAL